MHVGACDVWNGYGWNTMCEIIWWPEPNGQSHFTVCLLCMRYTSTLLLYSIRKVYSNCSPLMHAYLVCG